MRLYQHPVVAGSMILVAAAIAQVIVWLAWTRLPFPRSVSPSSLVAHGLLHDLLTDVVTAVGWATAESNAILHVASLLLALLSGIAWYGIGRLGLGPKWGFWVGLCWVVHPSFALPANQADKLNALIALVSAAWCVLLWWRLSRKVGVAMLFGILCAITCMVGFQGLILMAITVPAMMLSTRGVGGRSAGVLAVVIGFAVGAVLLAAVVALPRASARMVAAPANEAEPSEHSGQDRAWTQVLDRLASRRLELSDSLRLGAGLRLLMLHREALGVVGQMVIRLDTGLWNALDDTSGSFMATAARAWSPSPSQSRPPAVMFLARQCQAAPGQAGLWLAERLRKSVYATTDGQTHYPLVLLQFSWLIPALWGWWIAFRYRPWRWLAVAGGLFTLSQWVLVAVAEPLARNLVPVGGFAVLFALVGVTDIYERFFGRRLTAPAPASRPARLRRIRRNADDAGTD